MLVECRNLLLSVMLQVDSSNMWTWIPDLVVGYMVSEAYQLLTARPPSTIHVPEALLWRKEVLLKIIVFTWWLLHFRLPTKSNLYRRGIISSEAHMFVTGYGYLESFSVLSHFLVKYGIWCETECVFTLRIISILLIIFISFVLYLVAPNLGAPSCFWFGLLVIG
jgi:hypothetical protein